MRTARHVISRIGITYYNPQSRDTRVVWCSSLEEVRSFLKTQAKPFWFKHSTKPWIDCENS